MTLLEEIQQRLNELPLEKHSEVLDFIAFLQQRTGTVNKPSVRAEKTGRIRSAFEKIAKLDLFKDIPDPVEWQRQIRKDRPLPGRTA